MTWMSKLLRMYLHPRAPKLYALIPIYNNIKVFSRPKSALENKLIIDDVIFDTVGWK